MSETNSMDRPVGAPRRLRVSFACNDPENPGRVWAAQPESLYRVGKHPWDAELTHDCGRGVAFAVDAPRMRLRLHRQWFAYKRCIPYFGNMMWDAFEFERGTGARLLYAMRRDGGWHCEAGPSSFYRWWNRRTNTVEARLDVFNVGQQISGDPNQVVRDANHLKDEGQHEPHTAQGGSVFELHSAILRS